MSTLDPSALEQTPSSHIPLGRLAVATVIGAVVAALGNMIVYVIANAAGSLPDDVPVNTFGGEQAIDLPTVLAMSFVPILLAGVVLAVICRVSKRPFTVFWAITVLVWALSLASIFSIEDAPGDMIVTLIFMHAVAAFAGVGVLSRLARD
jgi:hypothetical protein